MSSKHVQAITFDNIAAHSMVRRYHTENTRPQALAEHCFRVALFAVKVFYMYNDWLIDNNERAFQDPDHIELALYQHALTHELSELDFGDVPSHVKKKLKSDHGVDWNEIADKEYWNSVGMPKPPVYPEVVEAIVTLVDTIEGAMVARGTIPEGKVRDSVMADWDKIWNNKLEKLRTVIDPRFLFSLSSSCYHCGFGIDKAWI